MADKSGIRDEKGGSQQHEIQPDDQTTPEGQVVVPPSGTTQKSGYSAVSPIAASLQPPTISLGAREWKEGEEISE